MTRLSLTLPAQAPIHGAGDADVLGWFLHKMSGDDPRFHHKAMSVKRSHDDVLEIGIGDTRYRITIPAHVQDGTVAVSPGLKLVSTDGASLGRYLQSHWRSLDHVGLNIARRDLDAGEWRKLIAAVAQHMPAYRLDIGSSNDIIMIVDDRFGEPAGVVELVYDKTSSLSSFHICAAVDVDRIALETQFPPPFGGYKPGDEAFFRSVALSTALHIPAYLDLAFADGDMMPWPDIVRGMGTRIR